MGTPVCIAGVHRSGTSMVAKLLHQSGIFFGNPEDLIAATPDNPDGHWEHRTFVTLNEAILSEVGAGWDCPPPATIDWKHVAMQPRLRRMADALLARFTDSGAWGWKDPRTTLTLPFWLELLPDLAVIVCIRNPLDVAASLKRRGLSSYTFGLRLWHQYNQRLLEYASPTRRLATHYAAVLSRPQHEIRRMLEFLEVNAAANVIDEASTSAREQLRHNRFTSRDLVSADVAPDILQLYMALCDAAAWNDDARAADRPQPADPERSPAPVVDTLALDNELLRRERDGLASEIAARDRVIRDLQVKANDHAELQASNAALHRRVEELEATLQEEQKRRQALEAPFEYERTKQRLSTLIGAAVPRGATMWMVSRGDDALMKLTPRRRTLHYPQTASGAWAGHYPADDAEAIAQLEELKAKEAGYLVFPAPSLWWLDHYRGFRAYLAARYRTVASQPDTGTIFDVSDLPWQRRLDATIDRFQKRFGRAPAMLDWNSGLTLEALVPGVTVFTPPAGDAQPLPYLDRSVDIVVCPAQPKMADEARRVASGVVVFITRTEDAVTVRPEWIRRR